MHGTLDIEKDLKRLAFYTKEILVGHNSVK